MSVVTTMQRESQVLAAYSLYKCLYSSEVLHRLLQNI